MASSYLQKNISIYLLLLITTLILLPTKTQQLKSYETQILLQLYKHLQYPSYLQTLNTTTNFCTIPSSPNFSIQCQNDSIIQLQIIGTYNKNRTLSASFSFDSFITTLTRLPNLKILSLISLGMWGEIPSKIHRLVNLEVLDMSSNYIYGTFPVEMSRMVKLQIFTFDSCFLNGSLPDWFGLLDNLSVLSLKGNSFSGNVGDWVTRNLNLSELVLSNNLLNGIVPDLSGLDKLRLLDLRGNGFSFELPGLPNGVVNVFLSGNEFKGSVREGEFERMSALERLDLSGNGFSGRVPVGLFDLPSISYLNLSGNEFSGGVSEGVKCGEALTLVDISSNRLVGELPDCLDGDRRTVRVGGNCLSGGVGNQHSVEYCKVVGKNGGRYTVREVVILAAVIGGIVVFVVLVLVVGLLIYCRRKRTERTLVQQHVVPKVKQDDLTSGISSDVLANARMISEAAKMGNQNAPTYRVFSVEELDEATERFDQSAFLGEGSLGQIYKGKLENGTFVAVRSLTLHRKYSIRNLRLRLDLLSKLHHSHLVGLLGHCIDGGMQDESTIHRLFLVHEFVPNGNFRSRLSETCPEKVLKWPERLAVLIGVAKAVHFLHTGVIPPSICNRLKTNNILFDENGIAKLSDYGMSIIADETEKPEAKRDDTRSWHAAKLEDDVYDFGFILLESLVGPIVSGKGETFLLNEMTSFGSQDGRRKIVDPIVLTTSSQESLSIVVSITNKCISPESSTRPSFEEVLWNLKYAAQVQATADIDQKSDTTSQSELQLR